jgi:photosystem II stability/assembly factor-like uncharacterized protein
LCPEFDVLKKTVGCILIVFICHGTAAAQGWQWQNPLPQSMKINDICMMDEWRAFAVCDNGYFMRSGDGGRTWQSYRIATDDLYQIVKTQGSRLLVMAGRQQILLSDDFGSTWTLQYKAPVSVYQSLTGTCIVMSNDSLGLACFGSDVVVKTMNGGSTWTTVPLSVWAAEKFQTVAIQSPSTWWLSATWYVYKSTDAGATWNQETAYSAQGLNRIVFFDSLNGFQLQYGRLLQTTDGASTWNEMNIFGFGNVIDLAGGAPLGKCLYSLSTNNYLVNASSDGGQTWNISLTKSAFPDANPMAISFVSPNLGLIAGEGGRILRTEDGGASWSIVHGIGYGGAMRDVVFTTAQDGIALSQNQTLLWTSNGGSRWNQMLPVYLYSLRAASMYSTSSGFAYGDSAGYKHVVFQTTDIGKSWTMKGTIPIPPDLVQQISLMKILALSDNDLLISASGGRLYRSTDAGATFDSITVHPGLSNDLQSGLRMFYFPPDTVVYCSRLGDAVSGDEGMTWAFSKYNAGGNVMDAEYITPKSGFHVSSMGLGKTTDGGQTWKHFSERPDLFHFFDEKNGIAFTAVQNADAYIGLTSDGGAIWEKHTLHERVPYACWRSWFFTDRNTGWVVGDGGMIRHTTNGGITFTESAPKIAEDISLGQSYPNPLMLSQGVTASIPFSFSGSASNVRLSIWNMLGEMVALPIERTFDPGRHVISFDAARERLKPGMYFYKLQVGSSQQTKRFVVLN